MDILNRKEFLKKSAAFGGCCATAILAGVLPVAAEDKPSTAPCPEPPKPDPKFSTFEQRVQQGQKVIKRLIRQLDQKFDPATAKAFMETVGQTCFNGSVAGQPKPTAEHAKGFMDYMRSHFPVREVGDETVIDFKYEHNPRGLKVADGYCLCDIFEIPPTDVPPSYCNCSAGYVAAMFEHFTGKPAKVEVTDTILRNGKPCSFTVRLKTA